MRRRSAVFLAPMATYLLLTACGSPDDSEFGDGNGGKGGSGTKTDVIGGDEDGTGTVNGGGLDRNSACATGSAAAQRGVSYLAFQFDRSGSMGKTSDANSNISVCKNVLKTFFSDPKSTGFNASLSLFPQRPNGQETKGNALLCTSTDYATPVSTATMQALPSSTLTTAVSGIEVQEDTPTLVALQGANAYAKTVSAANGGAKVAIVLVTDGEPNACPKGTDASDVAAYAKTISAETPTYVIGIGKSLTNLNKVAQAGAGRDAFLVDTSNPSLVQTQFTAALDTVKALNASCELTVPTPPAGQTLDVKKVNVLITIGGTEANPIYDAACKADGWHYDNPSAPTKVILCPNTCTKVQADPAAKVDLLFGCATAGQVN